MTRRKRVGGGRRGEVRKRTNIKLTNKLTNNYIKGVTKQAYQPTKATLPFACLPLLLIYREREEKGRGIKGMTDDEGGREWKRDGIGMKGKEEQEDRR